MITGDFRSLCHGALEDIALCASIHKNLKELADPQERAILGSYAAGVLKASDASLLRMKQFELEPLIYDQLQWLLPDKLSGELLSAHIAHLALGYALGTYTHKYQQIYVMPPITRFAPLQGEETLYRSDTARFRENTTLNRIGLSKGDIEDKFEIVAMCERIFCDTQDMEALLQMAQTLDIRGGMIHYLMGMYVRISIPYDITLTSYLWCDEWPLRSLALREMGEIASLEMKGHEKISGRDYSDNFLTCSLDRDVQKGFLVPAQPFVCFTFATDY